MQQKKQIKIASIKQASKVFDKKYALKDITLNIYQGEVLAILGPNGAGKTTLINLMLGRLSLSSGDINILGYQPGDIALKRLSGAMLQVAKLPDMSTIKEHIELFQSYYVTPMPYQQVIALAGLTEIENSLSKNLSGGQKQRLLFALSICGNPKLLFLDEPSVGMDINARKSLWQAITALKQQGTSVILTTHYLEEADQLSDRIIMINQGCIIEQGSPSVIKSRVNSKLIRFFSTDKISHFSALSTVKHIEKSGKYYEIQSNYPENTLKELFAMNTDIADISITGADLEEAFILINEDAELDKSA